MYTGTELQKKAIYSRCQHWRTKILAPAHEPVSEPGPASVEKTGIPSSLGVVDASDQASVLAQNPSHCSIGACPGIG